MRKWLGTHWKTVLGSVLTLAAITIILVLAFMTGAEKPPTRSTNLLLAVVAAAFQIAAGWLFSGVGKADPAHAEASSRRLFELASHAAAAKELSQKALEKDSPKATLGELRNAVGNLSVHLSYIEDAALGGVDDWRLVHEAAVRRATTRVTEQLRGLSGNGNQ